MKILFAICAALLLAVGAVWAFSGSAKAPADTAAAAACPNGCCPGACCEGGACPHGCCPGPCCGTGACCQASAAVKAKPDCCAEGAECCPGGACCTK